MDRGAWQATVHRVAQSRTRLSMHMQAFFGICRNFGEKEPKNRLLFLEYSRMRTLAISIWELKMRVVPKSWTVKYTCIRYLFMQGLEYLLNKD